MEARYGNERNTSRYLKENYINKEIMKNKIRSLDQKQKQEKTLNKSLDLKH